MRLRTKLAFIVSGTLLVAFAFFVSPQGHQWLWVHADRNAAVYSGWDLRRINNDITIGIAMGPWVYLLVPGLILGIVAILWRLGHPRGPKSREAGLPN